MSTEHDAAPRVSTLSNGVRVVTIELPHLQTASVSVFVRCGSAHEARRFNGIGHVEIGRASCRERVWRYV